MRTKQEGRLTDLKAVKSFVTAGRATFTLVSKRTLKRFTFKTTMAVDPLTNQPVKPERFYVKVLTGPDKYTFIGRLQGIPLEYKFISKPYGPAADAPSVKAFRWFWWMVNTVTLKGEERFLDQVEFWHEGSCGRCGRQLTVPSSIASGIGPECAQRLEVMGLLDELI